MIQGKGRVRETRSTPPPCTQRMLIWCSARLGHELCSGSNRKQTPSSSAPSAMQSPHPHPASHFAKHFGRHHSALPSHSRLNQSKVAELGLLVTLPNFANQTWCESSCDRQRPNTECQINQLEGTQQNWVVTTGWVNSHHPQYYRCWVQGPIPWISLCQPVSTNNLRMKHFF